MKSRMIRSKRQTCIKRKYLSNITHLWEYFNKLRYRYSELVSDLFNEIVINFHKPRGKKGIIAFILKGLYQQKDQLSRKMVETIGKPVDKGRRMKKNVLIILTIIRSIDFTRATKV